MFQRESGLNYSVGVGLAIVGIGPAKLPLFNIDCFNGGRDEC